MPKAMIFVLVVALITGCAAYKTNLGIAPNPKNTKFETIAIGNARFNFWLDIPSDWQAFDRAENGDGYFIECGNDGVDMRVYGEFAILPDEYYLGGENAETTEFTFDSGVIGWQITGSDRTVRYLYKTGDQYVAFYLDYGEETAWFYQNREIIIAVAKSLRNGHRAIL